MKRLIIIIQTILRCLLSKFLSYKNKVSQIPRHRKTTHTHTHTPMIIHMKRNLASDFPYVPEINITKLQNLKENGTTQEMYMPKQRRKISSQIYDFRKHTSHAFFLKNIQKPYPNSLKDK